ncbi:MAG: T9SS type A sorting domain-containing protein [Taibaiella sp.]|nr:T9SS type A sorting domain-containing protein [Taibaiella sp.]
MRTLIFCALLLGPIFGINAATLIATTYVSGHWTSSGSPYMIANDIIINDGTLLIIDPGVEVVMQGDFSISVAGNLQAKGTSGNPITFRAQDTTGWAGAGTAGGWKGITFASSAGTNYFEYCNVSDTKASAISCYIQLTVMNCHFFHNQRCIELYTDNADEILEVSGCEFYDNSAPSHLLSLLNLFGGGTNINNTKIHHNFSGGSVVYGLVKLQFDHNDVYENEAQNATIELTGTSSPFYNEADISHNKIHHNRNTNSAAVWCYSGSANITQNLICNNMSTTNTGCSLVEGGGGIWVFGDGDSTHSVFLIDNNIIANNYTAENGGGIKVYDTKATITNNHIINNMAFDGSGVHLRNFHNTTIIRNNIFTGNLMFGTSPATPASVAGYSDQPVFFDHNWITSAPEEEVNIVCPDSALGVRPLDLSGDILTNIEGTDPGMASPTTTPGTTEDATAADFGLTAPSPCIDKGDNTTPGVSDYFDNIRIHNGTIDIGAIEYGSSPYIPTSTLQSRERSARMAIFPNPAGQQIAITVPRLTGNIFLQNLNGQVVAAFPVSANPSPIDIKSLPRGMYLAIWHNDEETQVERFVAE